MVTPDAQGDRDRCEHGFTRAHYACPMQGEALGDGGPVPVLPDEQLARWRAVGDEQDRVLIDALRAARRELGDTRARLAAAREWLADADPDPERNGDHFRELRLILGATDQAGDGG